MKGKTTGDPIPTDLHRHYRGKIQVAPKVPVKTEVQTFLLREANEAMNCLRQGQIEGAAVLAMQD